MALFHSCQSPLHKKKILTVSFLLSNFHLHQFWFFLKHHGETWPTATRGLCWCEICWCAASWLNQARLWGEAPVLNYSPHIHLAVPIIQGSVHKRSLPASPSCEKWVMEFKGAHNICCTAQLLAMLWLSVPPQRAAAVDVQLCVLQWNLQGCCVNDLEDIHYHVLSAGIKAAAHAPCVSPSLSLLKLAQILTSTWLEIKIYASFDFQWGWLVPSAQWSCILFHAKFHCDYFAMTT